MPRFERADISAILLSAPAWARVGLTVRDEKMRERAADTLAATIVECVTRQDCFVDRDQLVLPI